MSMKHSDIEVLQIGHPIKLRALFDNFAGMRRIEEEGIFVGMVTGNDGTTKTLTLNNVTLDGNPFSNRHTLDYDAILEDLTDDGLSVFESCVGKIEATSLSPLPVILERMYGLSVWDNDGRQYLPVFDYEWRDVTNYMPADAAIKHNVELWYRDEKGEDHGS